MVCAPLPLLVTCLKMTKELSVLHVANEESVTAQQHEFRTDVYTEPPRHVDICRLLLKQTDGLRLVQVHKADQGL